MGAAQQLEVNARELFALLSKGRTGCQILCSRLPSDYGISEGDAKDRSDFWND
jgi:hypothetical protein